MLTPSRTPNQTRSMPSFARGRREQRHDDEGDLEEVEEEREEEDEDVDEDQEADCPAGQIDVSMCSIQRSPSTPLEDQAEHASRRPG